MTIIPHHGVAPNIHPTVFIADGARIIGEVEIGEDAGIWYNVTLRGDINRIVIGPRTNVQDGAVFHVTKQYPAIVHNDVTVGHGAIVHACTVEECCLIGMGSVVLDGARIGKYSLVAAGAVVKENFVVPEGSLVAGVPARVMRPLDDGERLRLRQSALDYVEFARSLQR